jgi:imidazolonepropionase-like amidohydrolase
MPEFAVKKAREAEDAIEDTWKLALKHGVRVAMGTDAGTPFNYHGDNAREVELYVQFGMKNADALATATTNAAELLGKKGELGAIVPGAYADMLVLKRNPLKDVRALSKSRVAVLKGGKLAGGALPA